MGKIMVVENKLRINTDSGQFFVEEGKIVTVDSKPDKQGNYNKAGDVIWSVVTAGYTTNLINALNRCLDWQSKELPDMGIKQFLQERMKQQEILQQYLNV